MNFDNVVLFSNNCYQIDLYHVVFIHLIISFLISFSLLYQFNAC